MLGLWTSILQFEARSFRLYIGQWLCSLTWQMASAARLVALCFCCPQRTGSFLVGNQLPSVGRSWQQATQREYRCLAGCKEPSGSGRRRSILRRLPSFLFFHTGLDEMVDNTQTWMSIL
ncbi:unnamed protein product [Effrenium voratum]|nr:unnamed protein product [Effrenium voratum]